MLTIEQLDEVLEAVWKWEVSRHGAPANQFYGRAVFEAVMLLQEWLLEIERGVK